MTVTAVPTASQPEVATPSRSVRGLVPLLALLLLAAAPALAGLVSLLAHVGKPYDIFGDQAIAALHIRQLPHHWPLLGPYSRDGWHHPGPLLYYWLAAPYYLLGRSGQGLAVGTLIADGACLVAIALVVRRRFGTLWAAAVVAVVDLIVLGLEPGFLRDSWNPYLPVLPLLLTAVLCWAVSEGRRWALPWAVVLGSFAVQSHVGFALPVLAALACVPAGALGHLLGRRRRDTAAFRGARRWLLPVLLAGAAGLLAWLPPIYQQLTTQPGNLGVLLRTLPAQSPSLTWGASLRTVLGALGSLPAALSGRPLDGAFLPPPVPAWATGLALGVGVLAVVVAVRRREASLLRWGLVTLAVLVAGLIAVSRVSGPPYHYVAEWAFVIGMLWWSFVILTLGPHLVRWVATRLSRLARLGPAVGVALLAAAPVALTISTARHPTPQTDTTGQLAALARSSERAIAAANVGGKPVYVVVAPSKRALDTIWESFGLVYRLVADGVDVRVGYFTDVYPAAMTHGVPSAAYRLTLAATDGSSPPLAPGEQVLGRTGDYQLYGRSIRG